MVKDRNDPIAQLGPLDKEPLLWQDRLAREGRLRLGSQDWVSLAVTKLDRSIPIQASLLSVREEPSEVRRR